MTSSLCSQPNLENLPSEIFSIILDHLNIFESINLDSALCNHSIRPTFLEIYPSITRIYLPSLHFRVKLSGKCALLWITCRLRGLQELDISCFDKVSIKDEDVQSLVKCCPYMERLNISGCFKISDGSLRDVSAWKNLKEINLSSCYRLTDKVVASLCCGCPNLSKLDLSYCSSISNESLYALSSCGIHLTSLNLSGNIQLDSSAFEVLFQSQNKLVQLNVGCCRQIDDDAVIKAAEYCEDIRELCLAGCILLTDTSMRYILNHNHFGQLTHLDIGNCRKISRGIESSIKALPKERMSRLWRIKSSIISGEL